MLKLERYKHLLNRNLISLVVRNSAASLSTSEHLRKSNNLGVNELTKFSNLTCLNKKEIKKLNAEYSAALKLVSRSFNIPQFIIARTLNTSAINFCKDQKKSDKPTEDKKDSDPKPPSYRSDGRQDDPDDDKKKKEDEERFVSVLTKSILWMIAIYMLVGFLTMVIPQKNRPETTTRYVSWNEFVHHMLATGEVKELILHTDMEMVTIILHDGAVIKGRRSSTNVYHMAIGDVARFEEKVRDVEKRLGVSEGVSISYERGNDLPGRILFMLVATAFILALINRMRTSKGGPLNMDGFTQMTRAKFTLVDPVEGGRGVFFKDVAGLQEAKQEVIEFVDYLKRPERYQKLGAKVPRGALLLGPPGCGKTLLAKAVATEAKVPFLSMNGSEFIEMIGGLGAARVRDLFKEGKNRAPCIIYIDEIDAIGRKREGVGGMSGMTSGESEQTLNQLLVEMDGISSKEGVLMLASTNRADILDKALLRPGRFDRHILIDLPNLHERKEIFEKHLSGIHLEEKAQKYSGRLATLTPGFSGADIANVCNEAALHAARNSQKIVTVKNLEYAVERLVGGTEKRSHAMTPIERRTVAFHESGHALVGWLLPNSDVLLKVTIVPRTSLALGFAQYTPKEQKLYTKEHLFDKMCMALGGRAAENITFSRITTGAQNDLEKVTKIAYAQIREFGMNERIGCVSFPQQDPELNGIGDKPYSQSLSALIDDEARRLVNSAYDRAEKILKDNNEKLVRLAEALLEKETLNYDEVCELIGPPQYDDAKRKLEPVEFEDSLRSLSATNTTNK